MLEQKDGEVSIRVLFIEDNPDDQELLRQHLSVIEQKNILLECSPLLSAGLKRLEAGGIDLVLLDLSLPDSSGLDTLRRLHELMPAVPVVVLTGIDDNELALKSIKAGAQDYVVKGQTDTGVLVRSINYAIERQHLSHILTSLEDSEQRLQLALKSAKEELACSARKQQEQIAHAIVHHAPIGIVILDGQLRVTDANGAFAAMVQRDLQKVIGEPLTNIAPSQVLETARQWMSGGKQQHATRLYVEIANQNARHHRYWDLSLWPVAGEAGQLTGAVLLIFDCTDKVLLQQQRDDFVASVAHDIKNPLVGAERIFASLCDQSQPVSPEQLSRSLSLLRESNHNLLSLVENLVDIYRYETLSYPCHYEDVDLKGLIADCIEHIKPFAESHKITLYYRIAESLSKIQADAIGLRRVLMNLLHNAVKFNKDGGAVHIAVEHDEIVCLKISDTGIGISHDEKENLFQRFGQGKAGRTHRGGSGLGLYLCKQIIEAHKGQIACESSPGCGSTFTITLPAQNLHSVEKAVPYDD